MAGPDLLIQVDPVSGAAVRAAFDGSDRRQSAASPEKKPSCCSRSARQKPSDSATASPPILSRAAATAARAPDRRTLSRSSLQQVADSGSGWPPQRFMVSMALTCGSSSLSVASACGFGSTFSDTSSSRPSVPMAPVIRRETS